MSKIGAFGDHTFTVSRTKILTPTNTSTKEELNYEMQPRSGKKPATYVKGQGEMNIQLTLHVDKRFVDPIKEHNWWLKAMRAVSKQRLNLYNHAWGTGKFIVVSVERSNDVALGDGTLASCDLQIKLAEWVAEGSAPSKTSAASSVSSAATASTGTLTASDRKASAVKTAEKSVVQNTARSTRGKRSEMVKVIIVMLGHVSRGCSVTVSWKAPDGHVGTRIVKESATIEVVKGSDAMLRWKGLHDYYTFDQRLTRRAYTPQTPEKNTGKKRFIAVKDNEFKVHWVSS